MKIDTNIEYNTDTNTLVGVKKRQLIDTETGEVIDVEQVTKRIYGTKHFWKCYLMDFLAILGVFDSKQVDVFIYMLQHTAPGNNTFIGTYRSIAEGAGVSVGTVATIVKKLQEHNFIHKVQTGVWIVNPNIIIQGNDNKRQMLISYFNEQEEVQLNKGQEKMLKKTVANTNTDKETEDTADTEKTSP